LLAARVLADFYRTVTIVERDVLPSDPVNRRGVPQGRHAHALLSRGSRILDELFPGLLTELVAGGAPVFDGTDPSEAYFSFGGHVFRRHGRPKDPVPAFLPSRLLLEYLVRQRVGGMDNITLLDDHDVVDLTSTSERDRVTGARVCDRGSGAERVLAADLVVDATGRGSRTPTFLDHLGYDRPAEDHIHVHVSYASQLLRLPPDVLTERIVLIGPVPGRPTGMALLGHENSTWIFPPSGWPAARPLHNLPTCSRSSRTSSRRTCCTRCVTPSRSLRSPATGCLRANGDATTRCGDSRLVCSPSATPSGGLRRHSGGARIGRRFLVELADLP
jgi:hypothetical protein